MTASASNSQASPESTTDAPFARRARLSAWASFALAVVFVALGIGWAVMARPTAAPSSVEVVEQADAADPTLLKEEVGKLRFHRPVRVVVWFRTGDYADKLNEETLKWARSNPDMNLLSPDGRKWADGTFILTVSVESNEVTGSGQVGTYFGEDVRVESGDGHDREKKIQQAGSDAFKRMDWTEGAVQVTRAAADLMARPWYKTPLLALIIPGIFVVAFALNGAGALLLRKGFVMAAGKFDSTTVGVNDRVTAAQEIPDVGLGEKIRATAGEVLRIYDDSLSQRTALNAFAWPVISPVNGRMTSRLKDFAGNVDTIVDATHMLQNAIVLYNRDSSWEQIWTEEINETGRALRGFADPRLANRVGVQRAEEFKRFGAAGEAELEDIRRSGIEGGGENIVQCLDRIADLRKRLSAQTQELQARGTAYAGGAGRYISKAIDKEQSRANGASRSITGYYDRPYFSTPTAFMIGYVNGQHNYQRAQQSSSSSSGSSTGYGSSGGGFSGSGSSSRF
ncbi:DUF5129 domain-containing protein [Brevibacterium moorei]|uniref:DUF5129 domain-containing protein n=1 Tax=Brevibacterium moorei TaxID=2968457 RepID=UPI00211C4A6D|nr:DUF5129 domain-containing protein [Brevibacterium sp. 68QC2CO]MCQ9386062.1 DUF5129 domain-containing protein [Brevibacterium sp. 68QC2CO]